MFCPRLRIRRSRSSTTCSKTKDAQQAESRPFFLYLPLTAPHTPIVPEDAFRGRSKVAAYGDFVMQVDATVGRVLDALETQWNE